LGIPLVLLIPEEFAGALDESTFTPWSKLKQGFEKYDREVPSDFESFTVELGGEETIDFNKDSLDVEGIINYLRFRGTLSGDGNKNFGETKKACSLNNFRSYFAPSAGLVHYYYGPGDAVKKGDLLCEILSMNSINEARDLEKAKTPIYAKDDGLVVFHATSSGVHQGMEIYSLMSEVFDL
jgi:predicted deacylase